MKQYSLIIPQYQKNIRLLQYLKQAFPLLPLWVIRDAFKRKDVRMDGVRVLSDVLLIPGSTIELFTLFEAAIEILFEDNQIVIVNKPSGISVDDDGRGGQTVLTWVEERACGTYLPRLCHRLDNQTSGLLVIAKNDEAEIELTNAFQVRSISKQYTCLVRGTPAPEKAVCKAFLFKDSAHARVHIFDKPLTGAKPIITEYTVLEPGETARLNVNLITGRTHQIRAHMAYLGHPLLGDDKYGDHSFNRAYGNGNLMLCATSLSFHTDGCLDYMDGRNFTINAPF